MKRTRDGHTYYLGFIFDKIYSGTTVYDLLQDLDFMEEEDFYLDLGFL